MQYLITTNISEPFLTDIFLAENNFNAEIGMVVYDLVNELYTVDGVNWKDIPNDHL